MIRRGRASVVAPALGLSLATAALLVPGGASAQGGVLFQDVPGAFAGQGCDGDGCWTNHLRLVDLDGDGDLDAIFPNASGFFSSPGAQPLEIWQNGGDGDFTLVTDELLGAPVVAAIRVVATGDVDGDGDLDLVGPSAAGQPDRLWIQGDDGTFTEEGAERLGTSSRSAAVRFGDVDGDGDLDLLVGQGYAGPDSPPVILLVNDGEGHFEPAPLPAAIPGDDPDDLDLVDVDGDFDLDVLVNAHVGPNALWLNDGTGAFVDRSDQLAAPEDGGFHYGPAACDVDGDGDRDLLIDNIGPGYTEQVQINDGTGTFTAESDRLSGNPGVDDNGVVCLDVDDDGDLDVAIPSLSPGGERLFENDGTGRFARVTGAFTVIADPTLWMEAGDVNGDGRLDVVTAQGEGSPEAERLYLGTDLVAIDVTPPSIFAWDASSFWPEIRFAIQDGSSGDDGPRVVEVQAEVPNTEAPFPATPMGGDLFRVVVPEGTETLSLCATDRAGNRGCVEVEPGPGPGTGGSGPGGGGPGGAGPGGSGPGAGGEGGGGATGSGGAAASSTTAGATAGGGGEGGDGDGRVILDRDCGCDVVGAPAGGGAGAGALALVLAAAGRRRRRR